MKFHVVNLGCKVNRVESDAFAARFLEFGWVFSDKIDADIIIINTCIVTGEAEKKTRKAIRRALRENEKASILITGCAAVIDAQGIKSIDSRVLVETDKARLSLAITEQGLNINGLDISSKQKGADYQEHFSGYDASGRLRRGAGFGSRVGMKIQDGCDNACTFCIVHRARGKAWSRDKSSVIEEARSYEKAGARELVLTGINIGSYRSNDGTLVDLLDVLMKETGGLRFRISSIEPCDVEDDLISLIASSDGRICRHFHMPLQSGSDKVLRDMARPYRVEEYRDLVDRIYEKLPMMSLSTDIIVGFPGESDDDFENSLDLVRQCCFSKVHIFPYSQREGTPAAARTDQIEAHVKASRIERMSNLAETMRKQDLFKRRNTIETVLVENDGFGMTESYHKVAVPATAKPGEVLPLKL